MNAVNDAAWKVGFKWTHGDVSNPAGAVAVDTTSKALHICDIADVTTDWNVAADSHPSVYVHSATTPATDYLKLYHDATDAYINAVGATNLYFQIASTTEFQIAAAALTASAPLTVGVDDTGYDVTFFGATASSKLLWDESADALELAGIARLDLSDCTVAAANTDGGVIKAGTSSARVIEDTADLSFIKLYWDNGATSGDNRGIYNRLYLTGAGGGGESLRSFTTIEDVAAGTAHGAHLSLSFGSTGSLTGLGAAVRGTLHIANQNWGSSGGTCAAVMAEIWADGANSDPVGMTVLSCFRVVNGGNATGMADTDDDAVLFDFAGWTIGTGNMLQTATAAAKNVTHSIKCRDAAGAIFYLYGGAAEVS